MLCNHSQLNPVLVVKHKYTNSAKKESAGSAVAVELRMWEGINTQETLSFKYTAPVGWAQLKNDVIGGFTLIIT